MGVKGITKHVSINFKGWSRVVLDGKHVVVHGNGLRYYIFARDTSTDVDLYSRIKSEFQNLLCHNVRPLVVLDRDFTIEKYEARVGQKYPERSVSSTSEVRSFVRLLADTIFCSVLKELQIPFLVLQSSGSLKQVASLARHFQCPLIGRESSFFFFDLPQGYIPWDEITSEEDKLVGKAIQFNTLWSEFGLQTKEIPLVLLTLLGIDTIAGFCDNSPAMSQTVSRTNSKILPNFKIKPVIHFLQQFVSFDEFLSFLSPTLVKEFIPYHVKVLQQFTMQNISGLDDLKLKLPPTSAMMKIPPWVERKIVNGDIVSSWIARFLVSNNGIMLFCKPDIDGTCYGSALKCSSSIREVVYSILHSMVASNVFKECLNSAYGLMEVLEITCKNVKSHPDITAVLGLSLEIKQSILLKALKCTSDEELTLIKELPPQLRLPVATSIYWIKTSQSNSQMKRALLQSMAFCQSGIPFHQSIEVDESRSNVFTQSQSCSCQWQFCYFSALLLNSLLQEPLEATSAQKVCNAKIFTFYALTPEIHRELGPDLDRLVRFII